MDKRRTIYKLVDLRGCIFMALLNLLFGAFLLAVLKSFPHIVSDRIQEGLTSLLLEDGANQIAALHDLVDNCLFYFYNAANNTILFSAVAMVAILLLIRLNGKLPYRKLVAWLIIIGVTLVNLASFLFAVRFMNSASLQLANKGVGLIMSLGYVIFICGLIILFFKTLRDLSQPQGVL